MSQQQFINEANDSLLFAKYRALSLGVTQAQVDLFELAYLRQRAELARSIH